MDNPFFSIILPTYNRAHFLGKAIQSVLGQSFPNWELIIVDDGSTDDTKAVVNAYTDSRIRYIYQENTERSAARNKGIENAKGEYICFLDSDDYFLPDKLAKLKGAIDNRLIPKDKVVFYDGLIFENGDERRSASISVKEKNESTHEFLLIHPLFSQQICAPRTLFDRHKYNTELRIGEDVELWLRIVEDAVFIPEFSHQTTISEHEDRSVNLMKYNSAKEQLKQLEIIFRIHDEDKISKSVRKKLLSDCFFNSAKHFMMNGKKTQAIFQLLKSIFKDPVNTQMKHRIYCLSKLITGQIPKEYLKR